MDEITASAKLCHMFDGKSMLTPSPHSAWVPILPRTSDAAPPPPLLSDDRPSNVAGIRPHYFVFGAGQELPAPAILPVPAPEAVPEVTEAVEVERPAKRRRLLAAAPARVGTRVDDLAPVPIPRTVRAPTRTSGRRSTKADKACARCR